MTVFYKMYQDNRTNSKNKGKWYARAKHTQVVDLNQLAEIMQRNSTVKKSDIMAVLTELVETMRDQLLDSKVVRVNGLGTFKIGIRTTGADKLEDFKINKNVVGTKLNFTPVTVLGKDKHRQKPILDGCKLALLPGNNHTAAAPVSAEPDAGV